MSMKGNYFREGEKGCSPLLYVKESMTWICGGPAGEVHGLFPDQIEFFSKDLVDSELSILSIAAHSGCALTAFGLSKGISIRNFARTDQVEQEIDNSVTGAPITHLAFNHAGTHLLIATQRPDILLYNLTTEVVDDRISTNNVIVRSFCVSPNDQHVAAMDLNGSVSIYAIEYDSITKRLTYRDTVSDHVSIVDKEQIRDFNGIGFKMMWLDDQTLLIPSRKDITILVNERENNRWTEHFLCGSEKITHADSASVLVIERVNNQYFLSADDQGKIILWKTPSNGRTIDYSTPVRSWDVSFSDGMKIYDVSYAPESNELVVVSRDEFVKIESILTQTELENPLPVPNTLPTKETPSIKQAEEEEIVEIEEEEKIQIEAPKVNVNVNTIIPVAPQVVEDDSFISDEALLAFDLDTFTQSVMAAAPSNSSSTSYPPAETQKVVSSINKMNETYSADPFGEEDDFPVTVPPKPVAAVAPSTVVSKQVSDSAPAATTKAKASSSLGSLLKEDSVPNKTMTKAQIRSLFDEEALDDDAADDDDIDDFDPTGKNKNRPKQEGDDDEMLIEEDDLDEELLLKTAAGEEGIDKSSSTFLVAEVLRLKKQLQTREFLQSTPFHPVVHPSSSPFDEKRRRYLVWNDIGNITLREESIENRIEIRFTDLTTGKNETISDRNGFIMAALGADGAAFATGLPEETEEEQLRRSKLTAEDLAEEAHDPHAKGSLVYYHAFSGNHRLEGVNQPFRIQLYQREIVETIAVGKGFIAITTSKHYLRIYNSIGIEMSVTFLKGKIVSLIAHDQFLTVIYNQSSQAIAINDCYAVVLDVYEIQWKNYFKIVPLVLTQTIPLLQSKQLIEWVGYDVDQQTVTILDSLGNLMSLMNTMGCYQWIPILHIPSIRKSIDHKYWPVMIKNTKLVFVLLNGEKKPAVYPQPVVSLRPLRIPLSSTNPITLISTTGDKEKDREASTKEKFYQFYQETMKLHHYQNQLTQRNTLYQLDYYHLSTQPEDYEKISIFENSEILPHLIQQTNTTLLQYDKMLLKLFQEAIFSQQLSFAIALIYQFHSLVSLKAAIMIANHFGKRNLAEKIDQIVQQKEIQQQAMSSISSATTGPGYGENSAADGGGYEYPPDAMVTLPTKPPQVAGLKRERSSDDTTNDLDNLENANKLSRKVNALKSSATSSALVKKSKVVSPPDASAAKNAATKTAASGIAATDDDADAFNYHSHDEDGPTKDSDPKNKGKMNTLNPFMIQKTGNTPLKRKSVTEDLTENIKYSPSPKKPTLNVSRFSPISSSHGGV